jgi:hypothetical protein
MKKQNQYTRKSSLFIKKEKFSKLIIAGIMVLSFCSLKAQVGINEDGSFGDASAALDIKSTIKGVLFPAMSTTERNVLKSPVAGLLIFNTATSHHNYYNGSDWIQLNRSAASAVGANPATQETDIGVGVGVADPDNSAMLQVSSATKGFLLPRASANLAATSMGLIYYNTSTNKIVVYNNTGWASQDAVTAQNITAATGTENAAGVLIGAGTIEASAKMEVNSTTKGLLIPRMTSAQRDLIKSPADGLTIYNLDEGNIQFLSAFTWYLWQAPTSPRTFAYTGAVQNFVVPAGVTSITLEAWGAEGGDGFYSSADKNNGGKGGYVKGTRTVTPGDVLRIYVGGEGTSGETYNATGGPGGWNGGGKGGHYNTSLRGGAGGGASDVRIGGTALTNRVIVAGAGGGGVSYYSSTFGGYGNYPSGKYGGSGSNDASSSQSGAGGTQSAGGDNISDGDSGSLGTGGNAASGSGSGGGGAGYYGGSGGGTGSSSDTEGGGGGSSYFGSLTSASHTPNHREGNGQIKISW